LSTHPAGRDPDTNVIMIKQGREPPTFTGLYYIYVILTFITQKLTLGWFLAWDPYMWSNGKTYDQIKAEMGSDDLFKSITLEELSNKSETNPAADPIKARV